MFVLANALMPFSAGFRELGASEAGGMGLLFVLINSAWICFTTYYIIRHTRYSGKKLFFYLLFIMFFVQCFMTQIETLFFGHAFPVLTKTDIVLIMLAGLLPLLVTIPLQMKFFKNKDTEVKQININIKSFILKLCVIGVIYLFVYFIFGYFVAWQFEELRIFYTSSAEKLSFFGQLLNEFKTNPVIFPFQILRGILFGFFVLPLVNMITKSKLVFITSICLVYLCTAIVLIIPNVLFPDIVRIGHLIEMVSSMLLFGMIVGNILWKEKSSLTRLITHDNMNT
jgi:hypothetical protein